MTPANRARVDEIRARRAAIEDLLPLRYSYAGVTSYAGDERQVLTSDVVHDDETGAVDFGANRDQRLTRFVAAAPTDIDHLLTLLDEAEATIADDRAHVGRWLLTSAHARAPLLDLMHGDVSLNDTRAALAAGLLALATPTEKPDV